MLKNKPCKPKLFVDLLPNIKGLFKINDMEITVKETHPDKYRNASIVFEEDVKKIESVITVMATEVVKLLRSEMK